MNLLSKIRSELGQLSYSFKRRNTPKLWRDQVEAIRFLKVHNLPAPHLKGPRQEVWAVSVVKNELDILPSVLDHFFAQGIDRIIVADNLSTDGTREYLSQRANEDPRLIFAEDKGEGDISSFAALATALAATVGTGNIVGVATAIKTGGPGALFWMWIAAFFVFPLIHSSFSIRSL